MFLLIEKEEDFVVHHFAESKRYQFPVLKREVFTTFTIGCLLYLFL